MSIIIMNMQKGMHSLLSKTSQLEVCPDLGANCLQIYQQMLKVTTSSEILDCVAQMVTCLATDACLTADQGLASLIPAQSYTFVEIDHKIVSMVILHPIR